jgi:hypothetical protein
MAVVTVNDGLSDEEDNEILEKNLMQYQFNVNRERVPVIGQFVPLVPDHKSLCLRDSFFLTDRILFFTARLSVPRIKKRGVSSDNVAVIR